MLGYGVTVIDIGTSHRPKELPLANIGDINLVKGMIHTEHVEGEDTYGLARNTGIHPEGMPFHKRYVHTGAAIVSKNAPTCEALFPAIQDIEKGGDGHYSPNQIYKA